MKNTRILGALVGVEAVTPEVLKAVYKNGAHVLGSFIFGLPTDTPNTFDATADRAQKAGICVCLVRDGDALPRTVDFERWEHQPAVIAGVPITHYWLIARHLRPKMLHLARP